MIFNIKNSIGFSGKLKIKEFEIIFIGDTELELKNSKIQINETDYAKIEKIWNNELKRNNKLKNNKVLRFVSLKKFDEKCVIQSQFIEFKYALTDRIDSELNLGIAVFGVSGIIILKNKTDSIIFAKRNKNSAEYPNYLELIPSGHLDESTKIDDTINFKKHLLVEFEEETGISKSNIKKISTLGVIKDKINNVYDVCCVLEIDEERFNINILENTNDEYYEPTLVSISKLDTFVKENEMRIVPTSKAIIECLKLYIK